MTALLDPSLAHWPVSHHRTLVRRGKPAPFFLFSAHCPALPLTEVNRSAWSDFWSFRCDRANKA